MPRCAPIVVVDDDDASRGALCAALAAADFASWPCASVEDALGKLASNLPRPALVVLDLAIQGRDGHDVLRRLRERPELRDVPIVVTTSPGEGGEDEVARAFAEGADDFVRKPVRTSELMARICGQLRMREYIDTLARRERDAQAVLEITHTLSSKLDIRHILYTVVRRVAALVTVDRCSIVLARDERDGYVLAASDDENLRDLRIDLARYPEIREVMRSGAPLVIRDIGESPLLDVVRGELPTVGFVSVALIPIAYQDRPTGVLFLRSRHAMAFATDELSLLRTVANTTAIALRNAMMLQTLRVESELNDAARQEAESRLQKVQRYVHLFESGSDGIMVIDLAGSILLCNPRGSAILGHTESTLIGKKLVDLLSASERAPFDHLFRVFQNGIYPQGIDVHLRSGTGAELTLSINTSSVLREENAILLMFRDVTQERATESELKRTKEFLERVIDNSVDAIVASDMEGRVLLFNRAAQRYYGCAADDIVGKVPVTELYPHGVAEEIMRLIMSDEYGGSGRLKDYRCEMVDRSGERVPVMLSAALVYDDGKPTTCVALLTDLRERLSMEQRLAVAQSELRIRDKQAAIVELAGAAAHELNQPLTSVMGYAQLLKRRSEATAATAEIVDIIASEAERMAEIVRKIGRITTYETKSYVGGAKIVDIDKASQESIPNLPRTKGRP